MRPIFKMEPLQCMYSFLLTAKLNWSTSSSRWRSLLLRGLSSNLRKRIMRSPCKDDNEPDGWSKILKESIRKYSWHQFFLEWSACRFGLIKKSLLLSSKPTVHGTLTCIRRDTGWTRTRVNTCRSICILRANKWTLEILYLAMILAAGGNWRYKETFIPFRYF